MTTPHAKSNAREGDGVAVTDAMVEAAARVVARIAGEDFDAIGQFAQSVLMDTQREAMTAALQAQQGAEPVDELRRRLDSFVTEMEACGHRYDVNVRTYTGKLRHLLTATGAPR